IGVALAATGVDRPRGDNCQAPRSPIEEKRVDRAGELLRRPGARPPPAGQGPFPNGARGPAPPVDVADPRPPRGSSPRRSDGPAGARGRGAQPSLPLARGPVERPRDGDSL